MAVFAQGAARRVVVRASLATLAVVLAVAAFNLIVDPNGRVLLVDIAGFNQAKFAARVDSRTYKANVLRRCGKGIVVLGNSRSEGAIDPDMPLLVGRRVYNAALKGSSILEARDLGVYMLDNQTPQRVLLDLGFYMFSELRDYADDYAQSPLTPLDTPGAWLRYLFSFDTARKSFYTVLYNREIDPCEETGFGTGFSYGGSTRDKFDSAIRRYTGTPTLLGAWRPGEEHYQALETLLRELSADGVRVYPYVSPPHALHLEMIAALGLGDDYENWLRRIAQTVADVNDGLPGDSRMQLIDFSGYNSISTEPLPPARSDDDMRWYLTSAYNRPPVGELMVARLFSRPHPEMPTGFGAVINPGNIDAHLRRQRAAARAYRQAQRDDVAHVRALVADVAGVRDAADVEPAQEQRQQQREPGARACLQEFGGDVLIPAGTYVMGAAGIYPEERPEHTVQIDAFRIDAHEVTNEQFARFVNDTGYVTVAERPTDPADWPEGGEIFAQPGSVTFTPPTMSNPTRSWWSYTPGANWRHPEGPDSDIVGREHHPVVHVAWEDAQAYAKWAGRALPTEAQFEYAARSAREGQRYAWGGDEVAPEGEYQANTWQGMFPVQNSESDGYRGTAPVGCFPPNDYGVYDLIGNVWEWTADWYAPAHDPGDTNNPQGPSAERSYDPNNAGFPVKVIKGGSYLCAPNYCKRYRPAARHAQDAGLGTAHIGFRTVAPAEQQ